jgi:hypothetical protein
MCLYAAGRSTNQCRLWKTDWNYLSVEAQSLWSYCAVSYFLVYSIEQVLNMKPDKVKTGHQSIVDDRHDPSDS